MKNFVKPISLDYVLGLLVTDGNFVVSFKSDANIDATIKISSSTNKNTLSLVQYFFLTTFGFKPDIDKTASNSNRAPALRVQGVEKVLKVINFIMQHSTFINIGNRIIPLCGPKFRTMLIVKYLIENRKSLKNAKAVQIDLVKSIHKSSLYDPDLILGGKHTKTRAELEARYNLEPGSSLFAAKSILEKIDLQFVEQIDCLTKSMQNKSLKLSPDSLVAMTDGDGGFHASILNLADSSQTIQVSMTFTSETLALILVQIWLYSLGQTYDSIVLNTKPVLYRKIQEKDCFQAKLASLENIWTALQFFQKNPPLGDLKKLSYELVLSIVLINKDRPLTLEEKNSFIIKINEYRQNKILKDY
jgi:hypothetical protein